jgi:syntaxin 1B/2/3
MPPMPTGRHDAGYRPPVPPSPTYNNGSRGDRHADSKETYEMSQRTTPVQQDGGITTDQFFQEVKTHQIKRKSAVLTYKIG